MIKIWRVFFHERLHAQALTYFVQICLMMLEHYTNKVYFLYVQIIRTYFFYYFVVKIFNFELDMYDSEIILSLEKIERCAFIIFNCGTHQINNRVASFSQGITLGFVTFINTISRTLQPFPLISWQLRNEPI